MAIRCRNYHDDGRPIGRGCAQGMTCTFVHPDNPLWNEAIRRPSFKPSGSRPFGSSRYPRDRDDRRASDSWDPPLKSAGSAAWDAAAFDGSATTSTNTTKSPELGRWGRPRAGATTSQSNASAGWGSVSDSWKKTDDTSNSSKPAQDTSSATGWGAAGSTGSEWGNTSGAWGGDSGTGWGGAWGGGNASASWGGGNGSTEWGSGSNANPGWGNGNGSTEWGGGGDDKKSDKGKGKEKADEDFQMRDPSPRIVPPTGPAGDRPKKPQLPRLNSDAPPRRRTPSQSPAPSPLTYKPTATTQDLTVLTSDNLKRAAIEHAAIKTAHITGRVHLDESDYSRHTTPTSTRPTESYLGPKGRVALYSSVIRRMQHVALLQIEIQRAQDDEDRWKKTQASPIYQRATPATRKVLDSQRSIYSQKVKSLQERLMRSLESLADLPDLESRDSKALGATITKEKVATYTRELGDWFKDLELHKRLVLKQDSEDGVVVEEAEADTRPTATELLAKGTWSWKELKAATARLEEQVALVSEEVYAEVYTRFGDDMDTQFDQLKDALMNDEQPVHGGVADLDPVSAGINTVGDNLSAQAVSAGQLFQRTHQLSQELDALLAEKAKMNELYIEAEKQFEEFERWKEDDMSKIQEMTEQLQNLHLHKRAPCSSTPQAVKLDDLLEHIRPLVLERMHADLVPVFQALRDRCVENQERLKGEIDEMVKPALIQTEEICQRAMSMTISEASAHLS